MIVSHKTYRDVFIALMVLLVLTVVAAKIDFDRMVPGLGTAVALSIAVAKGVLIVLIFMHVKYSPRVAWPFAAAGFFWLGIMFVLMGTDYLSRAPGEHLRQTLPAQSVPEVQREHPGR